MALIGEVCELKADMKIAWKIKDFSSLSQEVNLYYTSPKFYFSGASWQLLIYPNGQTETHGSVSLHLRRMSTGTAVTVTASFSLQIVHTIIKPDLTFRGAFYKKGDVWGYSKVILRSHLLENLTDPTNSKFLLVMCTLTHSEASNVAESLFTRHQELCDDLKEIYHEGKRADCTLKVEGCDIPAHRMILENRSPVFAAMFTHDMKENQTGEIIIDDMEKSTMEAILMHMYTGDIDNPTKENVFSLYEAAEKYDVKYVKEICHDFIETNLSVDWVCDVIEFSKLFQDEELDSSAREYFYENVLEILDTVQWKRFSKENPDISIKLLSNVAKIFVRR